MMYEDYDLAFAVAGVLRQSPKLGLCNTIPDFESAWDKHFQNLSTRGSNVDGSSLQAHFSIRPETAAELRAWLVMNADMVPACNQAEGYIDHILGMASAWLILKGYCQTEGDT